MNASFVPFLTLFAVIICVIMGLVDYLRPDGRHPDPQFWAQLGLLAAVSALAFSPFLK